MKLWAIATLISCASVFTACTTNDNPVTPQEKPMPKVSTIYTASTIKAERNVAGQWMTLYDNKNERTLLYDYQWAGDRVVSIVRDNNTEANEMRVTTHAVYDLEYAE